MTDNKYQFAKFSPNYYAQSPDGIMLEAFPAMDEVLRRLNALPSNEKVAWGEFLVIMGEQFIKLGRAGK
jgi:hypothetical protein